MEIITKSEEETQKFAKDYAKSLIPGDILALEGDLGSGKTAFAKGIALELGVPDIITSPTFVVIKEYPLIKIQISKSKLQINDQNSNSKLIHVDCYRIGVDDIEAIGLSEYLKSKNNITIIEWAENIKSVLPKRTKHIKFENLGNSKRKIIAP